MLTIIGIIVFVIIGKFVYDTYITGKTNRDWQRFKNSEPEKAARFERNRIIDFDTSPKSKQEDARQSLLILAKKRGCSPDEVKDKFQEHLTLQSYSLTQLNDMISIMKENKYKESKLFNIDPDDTPSAFLEAWAREYINKKQNNDKAVSKAKFSGINLVAMFANPAVKVPLTAAEIAEIEAEALRQGDEPEVQ